MRPQLLVAEKRSIGVAKNTMITPNGKEKETASP